MALIPAPGEAFFGVFVKFDELWVHSIVEPSKGLLKKVISLRPSNLSSWNGRDFMYLSHDCTAGEEQKR